MGKKSSNFIYTLIILMQSILITETNNYLVSFHVLHELALRYSEIHCTYSYRVLFFKKFFVKQKRI